MEKVVVEEKVDWWSPAANEAIVNYGEEMEAIGKTVCKLLKSLFWYTTTPSTPKDISLQ